MLVSIQRFISRGGEEVQVSSYIEAKQNYCVQCFVAPTLRNSRDEIPLVKAVTKQNFAGNGTWSGAIIDYAEQDALKESMEGIARQTIEVLPQEFVGWVGIDVLVDENGRQFVFNLNPRMTGSMPICLMSAFFWEERGLRFAQLANLGYRGREGDVFEVLRKEPGAGRVVVLADARIDEKELKGQVWLVWAAAEECGLEEMRLAICERLGCVDENNG